MKTDNKDREKCIVQWNLLATLDRKSFDCSGENSDKSWPPVIYIEWYVEQPDHEQ